MFLPINTLSCTETLTISSNRTIVSPGNVFEQGFFKTTASSRNGDHWYLGIWYKSISERTYGWVANRDNPLSKSIGTLKISYANLVLLDHSRTPVWSKNLTRTVNLQWWQSCSITATSCFETPKSTIKTDSCGKALIIRWTHYSQR